ncbi:hypothetical protein [Moraxella pluranimalium]|uniref:Lipoprotein n=1 Tax=Moraxella pluranimalium TaxID=470453 RepID=A0A1T0CLE9_9GAMM|nr:hypothetical protein [Moraxella pluranimalium]OOS23145.1 hypothetical protein B0680_08275 [Moraxella pluranimalium]
MKAYAIILPLVAAVALSACGKKQEHVYAVDKVEEAQAAAMEKAPKAEPMKFDDEGQPKVGMSADGTAAPAADAAATDAKATDAAAPAATETATDAKAEAPADKPADAAAEAKPEETKK